MPLTSLHIGGCPITNLSPLKHMKALTTVGIDPSTILFKPYNEAAALGNRAAAVQELEKVIADWSDVPAMKTCVDRAKALVDAEGRREGK